jgi:hypothetical protein
VCAANGGVKQRQRDGAENSRYEAFQLENPGFALIYLIAFFFGGKQWKQQLQKNI